METKAVLFVQDVIRGAVRLEGQARAIGIQMARSQPQVPSFETSNDRRLSGTCCRVTAAHIARKLNAQSSAAEVLRC